MDTNNNTVIVPNETIELGVQPKNIQEIKQEKTKISLKKKALNFAKKAFDYGSKIVGFVALAGVTYLLLKDNKNNTINNSNGIRPLGNSNDNIGKVSIDDIAKFGNCSQDDKVFIENNYFNCMIPAAYQMGYEASQAVVDQKINTATNELQNYVDNKLLNTTSDILVEAKQYTDNKILEVNNNLTGYATLSDLSETLSKYFTKDEINSLLTNLLENYVLKDDNSFITEENIIQILQDNNFLTQEQIENLFDEKYIKIDDALNILGNYVEEDTLNEILNNYVTIESLNDTIKKEDLENMLKQYNFVTNEELQKILENFADTSNFIDINYLNNVLKEYMSTDDVNTILADYIRSTELESYLTIDDFSSIIENYASKEELSKIKTSLDNFVKVSDLQNILSNYLQQKDINKIFADFVESDEFKNNFLNYVTFDDLQAELSNLTTKENITNIVYDIIKDSGFVTRQEFDELRGAITGNRTPIQNQNKSNKIKQLNADNSIDDEFVYAENKEVANTMYKVRSDISGIAGGLYTAGGGIAVAGLCIGGSIYAKQAMGTIKKKSKISKFIARITGDLTPLYANYRIDHEVIKMILCSVARYCADKGLYDIEKDRMTEQNERFIKQMVSDLTTELLRTHDFLKESNLTESQFTRRVFELINNNQVLQNELNALKNIIDSHEERIRGLEVAVFGEENEQNNFVALRNAANMFDHFERIAERRERQDDDNVALRNAANMFDHFERIAERKEREEREEREMRQQRENNRLMEEEGRELDNDPNNGVNGDFVNEVHQGKRNNPNIKQKQNIKIRNKGSGGRQNQNNHGEKFSGTRNL